MKKKLINLKALIIVLVTLLFIPLFLSCNGEEDYEDLEFYPYALHGYVKDYHTGKPLANVTFDLSCGQYFVGMQAQTKRYYYEGVAKTDSRGYYKIRIPKGNKDMDFSVVFPHPQNISGYNFEGGEFDCKQFATTSVRADISAISYGYLKVIMPKSGGGWNQGMIGSSYGQPRYVDKFLYTRVINDSLKYDFYIVAASTGWGGYYATDTIKIFDYEIMNPRDTIVINVKQ